jgi:6-phosphogluconolactonase (cycloisomerase 2 family)
MVLLAGMGQYLLVTNTFSGDMSIFAVDDEGLSLAQTVATGSAPMSVAEHEDLIYVLNTGDPSLTGFRLSGRATSYGFAFTHRGALIVTEAFGAQKGKAAASSYLLSKRGLAPVSRSVGNGRSEIYWAVATKDDRYVFTTNFADGAVSRYSIGADGSITLDQATAGLAVGGQPGLRDLALSSNNRFLYAVDADSAHMWGWAEGERGALSPIGSWDGLPATVAGLAAS